MSAHTARGLTIRVCRQPSPHRSFQDKHLYRKRSNWLGDEFCRKIALNADRRITFHKVGRVPLNNQVLSFLALPPALIVRGKSQIHVSHHLPLFLITCICHRDLDLLLSVS